MIFKVACNIFENKKKMKEELLQYLWQHKIFNHNGLRSTDGRDIHIISPGMMHHDAGPDFKQAVIRINDIIWAGDVEIHVNSSDWYRHHHQKEFILGFLASVMQGNLPLSMQLQGKVLPLCLT